MTAMTHDKSQSETLKRTSNLVLILRRIQRIQKRIKTQLEFSDQYVQMVPSYFKNIQPITAMTLASQYLASFPEETQTPIIVLRNVPYFQESCIRFLFILQIYCNRAGSSCINFVGVLTFVSRCALQILRISAGTVNGAGCLNLTQLQYLNYKSQQNI